MCRDSKLGLGEDEMRVAILTNTSENVRELTNVTLKNKSLYADTYGYKVYCCEMNYENYNNEIVSIMQANLSLMKENDVVMLMGADTMFMNHNIRVEDVFLPDDLILIAKEKTGWWPINDDVVIYRCVPEVISFYERLINDFEVWKSYPWRIQMHLWNLMQEEPQVRKLFRLVEPSVMNQHPVNWQLGDWIIHLYNMPVVEKIKLAEGYFNKWPDGKPVLKEKVDGDRPKVL